MRSTEKRALWTTILIVVLQSFILILLYTETIPSTSAVWLLPPVALLVLLSVGYWVRWLPNLSNLFRVIRNVREGYTFSYGHLLLVVIVFVGALIRSQFLSNGLQTDEARTVVDFANPDSGSFLETITEYGANNNHPANSVAIFALIRASGHNSEFVIRLPVLVFGILTIILTYLAGYELFNRDVGLLGASYVAFSPYAISYSVSARGYMMIAFSFVAMIWIGAKIIKNPSSIGWGIFIVLGVVGIYANLTMLVPLATVGLWLLMNLLSHHKGSLRHTVSQLWYSGVLIGIAGLVLYSPIFINEGIGTLSNQYTNSVPLGEFLARYRELTDIVYVSTWTYSNAVILLIGITLVVATIHEYVKYRRVSVVLVGLLVIGGFLILTRPIAISRRIFVYTIPIVGIYFGAGLHWGLRLAFLKRKVLSHSLLVLIIFTILYYNISSSSYFDVIHRTPEISHLPYTDDAILYLEQVHAIDENDLVLAYSGKNWIVQYYLREHALSPAIGTLLREKTPRSFEQMFIIALSDTSLPSIVNRASITIGQERIADIEAYVPLIDFGGTVVYRVEFITD